MKKNLTRVLKQKLPKLKKFLASDPRVLAVFLFGSQVDGYATPRSDIDLAVLFDRDLTLNEELAFEVAVCDTLGRYDDVDIVNLNRASLSIRFQAISGKLLYERDQSQVSDFIEQILKEYPDFRVSKDRFDKDYFESMRQDYAHFQPQPHR